jgi:hypothetical protein
LNTISQPLRFKRLYLHQVASAFGPSPHTLDGKGATDYDN